MRPSGAADFFIFLFYILFLQTGAVSPPPVVMATASAPLTSKRGSEEEKIERKDGGREANTERRTERERNKKQEGEKRKEGGEGKQQPVYIERGGKYQ